MTISFAVLALVAAAVVVMDLTIRRVYRYPKKPHCSTPAEHGVAFEEVRFPTRNGRWLYGWWMPAHTKTSHARTTVILVHGWGRNLERMMPYVRALHPSGCDLLAFDLRSHGSSESERYPNMLKFSEDIRASIDFLTNGTSREPGAIRVVGLSVGGAAAIHAAASDARIQTVVAVGALAHPLDIMKSEFQKRHLPYYPVGWLMLKYLQLRMGVNFDRIAPEHVVRNSSAKILLVHGELDTVVPLEHGRRLLASGNPNNVEIWVIPDRGHSDCHEHPDFWRRVGSFLEGEPDTVIS